MGYYTNYFLEVEPADAVTQLLAETVIEEVTGESNYVVGEYFEDKWYDHKDHLIEISKKLPDVKFTLTGYGEHPLPDIDAFELTYLNGELIKHLRGELLMVPISV